MEGKYEQSPDFCGFPLSNATFLSSTSVKAALFTAIVTSFVLDVLSDIDEDNATKLFRLPVEQSVTNSTTRVSPSDPSSSILTVSCLWFLSIMSSLAATTWAILCLEWCAFFPDGIQADDYEDMAEKRQRRFEAMERWKMPLVVAAIPFFLHLSLFLFLGGLWLRLRDLNRQLGLIVGVPSLVIASSYVVVSFLPIFTDAPCSTSASELIKPVAGGIRRAVEFGRSIHPPPVFSWIASLLPLRIRSWSFSPFGLLRIRKIPPFVERIYRVVLTYAGVVWTTIALLPIIPTFGPGQNPFDELNRLKVGQDDRDKKTHQRALFWLLTTPLSKDEVMEILERLRGPGDDGGKLPLDRDTIRLLVLSLSSILDDNRISDEERPIFNHCTTALAKEMDRAFRDGGYNQKIRIRSATVIKTLSPHFSLTTSDGDTFNGHSATGVGDYWTRAVSALWLCPSTETIRNVVNKLDSDMQSMEVHHLQCIVRGLHAATLACVSPNQSNLELIPDFSIWSWDSDSSDQALDKALSGYLRSLFAVFYEKTYRKRGPTTATSLVVNYLKVLNEKRDPGALKLHDALCFFVVLTQRSDPKLFEEGPSVAHALLETVEPWRECNREDNSMGAKVLATRLSAIAYGPRPLILGQNCPLARLSGLWAGLPASIKTNRECLEGFLEASAATLEAVLAVGGRLAAFAWRRSFDDKPTPAADILGAFGIVQQHPNLRLPYLYSLAIILSYAPGERNQGLWKMAELLVTHDERERIGINRALDANILVVTVLRFAQAMGPDQKENFLRNFLNSPGNIIVDGANQRAVWKSIYLIADLVVLLDREQIQREGEQMTALTDAASKSFQNVEHKPVPSDWERKREGLILCGLETKVKELSAQAGTSGAIYKWSDSENVPYLSLYNPPHTTYLVAAAAMFQQ